MSISKSRATGLTIVGVAVLLAVAASPGRGARAGQSSGPSMETQGAASILSGSQRIEPAAGTAGVTNGFAFRPYNLPGEFIDDAAGGVIEGQKFFDARANDDQPIQTSDW